MDGYGVVTDVGEEGGRGEGAEVGGDSAGVALGVFAAAFGGGRFGRHCFWVVIQGAVSVSGGCSVAMMYLRERHLFRHGSCDFLIFGGGVFGLSSSPESVTPYCNKRLRCVTCYIIPSSLLLHLCFMHVAIGIVA